MACTYTGTLTSPLDRVRHMLGDTSSNCVRSDATIIALLEDYPENETVMLLADSMASEFAMKPSSVSSPDGSMSWGDRVSQLRNLADRLRLEITEGIVEAAQDKLRSFAPARADYDDPGTSEYFRYPMFFDRQGNYDWVDPE